MPSYTILVNSYDPDGGQHSLLKTPVGLPLSLELVDSKACLQILAWLRLARNSLDSNDKHLLHGGTLSSPSNPVNSYDPDDGQLSLLKTPVGLPWSLELGLA